MKPRHATKDNEIARLQTDNHSTKTAWILIGEQTVTLTRQKNGEPDTGSVTLTRRDFHALIDWYQRGQNKMRKP